MTKASTASGMFGTLSYRVLPVPVLFQEASYDGMRNVGTWFILDTVQDRNK